MFDIAEINVFTYGPFTLVDSDHDFVQVQSTMTSQYWLIKKFDAVGLPKMVLCHAHSVNDNYHVHCVYDSYDALLCYNEIITHDKVITERKNLRERLTRLSNKQLVEAVFA